MRPSIAFVLLAAACTEAPAGDPTTPPDFVPALPSDEDLVPIEPGEVEPGPDFYAPPIQLEGEHMANVSGSSGVYDSPFAVYGGYRMRLVFANGDIGGWVYQAETQWRGVSVGAQGSWCTRGWPTMQVWIYDNNSGTWTWASQPLTVDGKLAYDGARYFPYNTGTTFLTAGWKFVLVRMGNDSYQAGSCDANLAVDYAVLY